MKKKFILVGKILVCFLVFEFLAVFVPELWALFLQHTSLDDETMVQLYQAGSSLLMILVAFPGFVLTMRLFGTLPSFSWKEERRATTGELVKYFFLSILPVFLLYGVAFIISRVNHISLQNMLGSLNWGDVIREGILGCLIMPVMEEVMFRGLMLHKLQEGGTVFAIVVTTLFFAIGHNNPTNIILGLATGWLFVYIVLKHGGIRYALLCHITVNILGNLAIPGIIQMASSLRTF